MSRIAVRIQNLGKKYQLGARGKKYSTIREAIIEAAKAPWRRWRELTGRENDSQAFWALRDISLDVPEGSALAIIGHNGAGKSTLLKILSRITEPTTGQVEIEGRLGSLLEVGTGFHLELTGRENIFVNAAILGMSHSEVKRRFDEIVAFSGVEKFLDTPVKRYSSGMQVRLAFSVAAHLEPEILVVDEVLSVGDAEFQNKCLGKMRDVASLGRTVLLVSHDMAAVESLCQRACLLDAGRLVGVGSVSDIVRQYLESTCELSGEIDLERHCGRPPGVRPIFQRLRMLDGNQGLSPVVRVGGTIRFEIGMHSETPQSARNLVFQVIDSRGLTIFTTSTLQHQNERLEIHGYCEVGCSIQNVRLTPGRYHLRFALRNGRRVLDEIRSDVEFEVLRLSENSSVKPPTAQSGVIVAEAQWDFRSQVMSSV